MHLVDYCWTRNGSLLSQLIKVTNELSLHNSSTGNKLLDKIFNERSKLLSKIK